MNEHVEHADAGLSGHADTVHKVRMLLGRTQSELAGALGISSKAVQSYEQGWRVVPARVLIQLLLLVALYRKQSGDDVPCWQVRRCDARQRSRCASYTIGDGRFCWFIGDKKCRPDDAASRRATLPCMTCLVVKRLLEGTAQIAPEPADKLSRSVVAAGARAATAVRRPRPR